MTTDPTTLPDDHVAAGRAYALSLQRDAEEALGRVTQERDRLAAELGQERALRVMREEELRVVREREAKLRAVAEAAQALAAGRRWCWSEAGEDIAEGFYEPLDEDLDDVDPLARALLAAGFDWRTP